MIVQMMKRAKEEGMREGKTYFGLTQFYIGRMRRKEDEDEGNSWNPEGARERDFEGF